MYLLFPFWQHAPFVLKIECISSKKTHNVQQIVSDKFKVWLTVFYCPLYSARRDSLRLWKLLARKRTLNVINCWSRSRTRWRRGGSTGIYDQEIVRQLYAKQKKKEIFFLCVIAVKLVHSVWLTVAPCLLQAAGGPRPVWVAVHRGTEALLSTWPVWTWLQRCATTDGSRLSPNWVQLWTLFGLSSQVKVYL